MNANEPVAWMIQYKDRHKFVFEKPTYSEHILACEPLYTHPVKVNYEFNSSQVKELTDEEIEEVMYKCDWSYDPVSFAKEILRKAQEK